MKIEILYKPHQPELGLQNIENINVPLRLQEVKCFYIFTGTASPLKPFSFSFSCMEPQIPSFLPLTFCFTLSELENISFDCQSVAFICNSTLFCKIIQEFFLIQRQLFESVSVKPVGRQTSIYSSGIRFLHHFPCSFLDFADDH